MHGDRADRGADDRRRDAEARALAELRNACAWLDEAKVPTVRVRAARATAESLVSLFMGVILPVSRALARCAGDHLMSSPDDERKPFRRTGRCSRRNRESLIENFSLIAC